MDWGSLTWVQFIEWNKLFITFVVNLINFTTSTSTSWSNRLILVIVDFDRSFLLNFSNSLFFFFSLLAFNLHMRVYFVLWFYILRHFFSVFVLIFLLFLFIDLCSFFIFYHFSFCFASFPYFSFPLFNIRFSHLQKNVNSRPQAYTSQFISLVMFALVMCEDRISMQQRRREILRGLKELPGEQLSLCCVTWKNCQEWGILRRNCLINSLNSINRKLIDEFSSWNAELPSFVSGPF